MRSCAIATVRYNLLPREITGGPTWIDSDAYDIVGTTPGGVRPKRSDEIVILRNLLADKFHLTFHAEQKESVQPGLRRARLVYIIPTAYDNS